MMPTPEEMLRMFDRYINEGAHRVVAMAAVRSWVIANAEEHTVEALAREAEHDGRYTARYADYPKARVDLADWLRAHLSDPTPATPQDAPDAR